VRWRHARCADAARSHGSFFRQPGNSPGGFLHFPRPGSRSANASPFGINVAFSATAFVPSLPNREPAMSDAVYDHSSEPKTELERPSRVVMASFAFFFVTIGAIVVGEMVGLLFR
jgi:hypothetical protein